MSGRFGPTTLHAELERILVGLGNAWMTTDELAHEVNRRGVYRKEDGSTVTPFQVRGRTRQKAHIFERDGTRVRLRTSAGIDGASAPSSPGENYRPRSSRAPHHRGERLMI